MDVFIQKTFTLLLTVSNFYLYSASVRYKSISKVEESFNLYILNLIQNSAFLLFGHFLSIFYINSNIMIKFSNLECM